jgi:hypothetical protein
MGVENFSRRIVCAASGRDPRLPLSAARAGFVSWARSWKPIPYSVSTAIDLTGLDAKTPANRLCPVPRW